jgi:hypothetical protein
VQRNDTELQAMMLLAVEKMTVCFPRMSQKLERFYKAVVEEALLGKYPDVAEDFTSGKLSSPFNSSLPRLLTNRPILH